MSRTRLDRERLKSCLRELVRTRWSPVLDHTGTEGGLEVKGGN